MILTLALRSLLAHPIRTAVLCCGFGFGVAVMATLLGVGRVILDQARSPALKGGGDVIVAGPSGKVGAARFVVSNVLGVAPLKERVRAVSPTARGAVYLVKNGRVVPLRAKGGIPSLERAMGDPETSSVDTWVDAPGDAAWSAADPSSVLRSMDAFHPIPEVPARAGSWSEWLYFNGRSGDTRFYLTFFVGPMRPSGRRIAGVRLQLDQRGVLRSYGEVAEMDSAAVLGAPDLTIGRSRVRLEGLRYRIALALPEDSRARARLRNTRGEREARGGTENADTDVTGEFFLEAIPGRSLPPITIRGAGGWLSGYVVPVVSGHLGGALFVNGERLALDGGAGYHDHNWGFWDGVTWQWGQVQDDKVSFVYGRVHPPPDAADAERVPGFLAALGPDGPLGFATDVAIEETNDPRTGRPTRVVVRARGPALDLTLDGAIEGATTTRTGRRGFGGGMDFLQLRARYRVSGDAAGRRIAFDALGSAETFRGEESRRGATP